MTTQNDTPANAGGNADAGNNSPAPDSFTDWDALASSSSQASGPVQRDADGVVDWDAASATNDSGQGREGEGEGGDADAGKKAEGDDRKKPEGDEGKSEDEKKRLSGAQRAKQQRERFLSEIAERDRRIAELEAAGKKPAGDAGDDAPKPPKEEDFNGDWFAYQRALAAHEAGEAARKATNEVLKSGEDQRARERSQREAAQRLDAHMDRVEAAREVIADYDKVMEGMKGTQIRNGSIEAIMSSEKSELISYHFATHPDQLTAFDSMTPRQQDREIGRLEATLKMPEPKKQTTAPPPLSKLKGAPAPRDVNAEINAYLDKTYGRDRKR
jgi:hypothetical protein